MKPSQKERLPLRLEKLYREIGEFIMEDVVRRIKKTGGITSTADYQINRLMLLGATPEELEGEIKKRLDASYKEMFRMYNDVIDWEYVRNKDIYEQVNAEFISWEENEALQQLSHALIEQSKNELLNLTNSMGFSLDYGNGKRVFTPLSEYYQKYLDQTMLSIVTGAQDYNAALRKCVTQMTNSGIRVVDYASGYSNRIDVAARRAVMTGVSQLAGRISDYHAKQLGTDYFEISWHMGARNTGTGYYNHQSWQGRVYSRQQLIDICGLGEGGGLGGWSCRHDRSPFIPGISERNWTDEWLDARNREENTPKAYNGKEYTVYQATQKQRQMETSMRAQREKVRLLQKGDADKDVILNERIKYNGQLYEYTKFSNRMGLVQQRERIYLDMRGRVGIKFPVKSFTDNQKNATIKSSNMYRKSRGFSVEPMPKKQFQRIAKAFKRQGGIIQTNAETDAYLKSKKAEAITYNEKTILLQQRPSRSAVYEELIHATQYREGKNDGTLKSRLLCEIEAQEKLLKYQKIYKLTSAEVNQTQKALKAYQKELAAL